jgi:hypothetical protein
MSLTKYKVSWDTEVFEHHEAEVELPGGMTPDDLTVDDLAGYESPQTQQSAEVEARDITEWKETS